MGLSTDTQTMHKNDKSKILPIPQFQLGLAQPPFFLFALQLPKQIRFKLKRTHEMESFDALCKWCIQTVLDFEYEEASSNHTSLFLEIKRISLAPKRKLQDLHRLLTGGIVYLFLCRAVYEENPPTIDRYISLGKHQNEHTFSILMRWMDHHRDIPKKEPFSSIEEVSTTLSSLPLNQELHCELLQTLYSKQFRLSSPENKENTSSLKIGVGSDEEAMKEAENDILGTSKKSKLGYSHSSGMEIDSDENQDDTINQESDTSLIRREDMVELGLGDSVNISKIHKRSNQHDSKVFTRTPSPKKKKKKRKKSPKKSSKSTWPTGPTSSKNENFAMTPPVSGIRLPPINLPSPNPSNVPVNSSREELIVPHRLPRFGEVLESSRKQSPKKGLKFSSPFRIEELDTDDESSKEEEEEEENEEEDEVREDELIKFLENEKKKDKLLDLSASKGDREHFDDFDSNEVGRISNEIDSGIIEFHSSGLIDEEEETDSSVLMDTNKSILEALKNPENIQEEEEEEGGKLFSTITTTTTDDFGSDSLRGSMVQITPNESLETEKTKELIQLLRDDKVCLSPTLHKNNFNGSKTSDSPPKRDRYSYDEESEDEDVILTNKHNENGEVTPFHEEIQKCNQYLKNLKQVVEMEEDPRKYFGTQYSYQKKKKKKKKKKKINSSSTSPNRHQETSPIVLSSHNYHTSPSKSPKKKKSKISFEIEPDLTPLSPQASSSTPKKKKKKKKKKKMKNKLDLSPQPSPVLQDVTIFQDKVNEERIEIQQKEEKEEEKNENEKFEENENKPKKMKKKKETEKKTIVIEEHSYESNKMKKKMKKMKKRNEPVKKRTKKKKRKKVDPKLFRSVSHFPVSKMERTELDPKKSHQKKKKKIEELKFIKKLRNFDTPRSSQEDEGEEDDDVQKLRRENEYLRLLLLEQQRNMDSERLRHQEELEIEKKKNEIMQYHHLHHQKKKKSDPPKDDPPSPMPENEKTPTKKRVKKIKKLTPPNKKRDIGLSSTNEEEKKEMELKIQKVLNKKKNKFSSMKKLDDDVPAKKKKKKKKHGGGVRIDVPMFETEEEKIRRQEKLEAFKLRKQNERNFRLKKNKKMVRKNNVKKKHIFETEEQQQEKENGQNKATVRSNPSKKKKKNMILKKRINSRPNKQLIKLAISHVCLAGRVNEKEKKDVLFELERISKVHERSTKTNKNFKVKTRRLMNLEKKKKNNLKYDKDGFLVEETNQNQIRAGVEDDEKFEDVFNHFLVLIMKENHPVFRALYVAKSGDLEMFLKVKGKGPKVLEAKDVESFFRFDSGTKKFIKLHSKGFGVTVDGIVLPQSYRRKKRKVGKRM